MGVLFRPVGGKPDKTWGNMARIGRRIGAGVLAAVLLVAVLAVVGSFAVRPIVSTIEALHTRIEAETRELAHSREELRQEGDLAREYEQTRQRVGVAASPAEAIAEFKGQIDALARQTGVAILKMDHRDPVDTDVTRELYVNVGTFEADFNNAIRFLDQIWQAPGVLRVVKLSLSPGGGRNMVKGSMLVTKLMFKDLSAAPATTAAPSPESPK